MRAGMRSAPRWACEYLSAADRWIMTQVSRSCTLCADRRQPGYSQQVVGTDGKVGLHLSAGDGGVRNSVCEPVALTNR